MKKIISSISALLISANCVHAATVNLTPVFQAIIEKDVVVPAKQINAIPIGPMMAGDRFSVRINTKNKVLKDITACFASEQERQTYTSTQRCHGYARTKTPFVIKTSAQIDGPHYLLLDNSYAAMFPKEVSIKGVLQKRLTKEEADKFRAALGAAQKTMTSMFENSDFDIHVKPCGQSNAFSNKKTADITICTEFIYDLATKKNVGALVAALLHEYGHSLLNRWGEPGANEEDMADQFATVMLLRAGDDGRRMLEEWKQYWKSRDSAREAQHQLYRGDTHTLSIQRARNINNAMLYPEDMTRRWNKMLYRHMKREALLQIIKKPNRQDDVDLAREALRGKE